MTYFARGTVKGGQNRLITVDKGFSLSLFPGKTDLATIAAFDDRGGRLPGVLTVMSEKDDVSGFQGPKLVSDCQNEPF